MLGYSFHFIVSIIVSFTNSVMDKKYSTFVRLLASSHSSVQKANRKNTHHGVTSTRRLEFSSSNILVLYRHMPDVENRRSSLLKWHILRLQLNQLICYSTPFSDSLRTRSGNKNNMRKR